MKQVLEPENALEREARPETRELLSVMAESFHGPLLSRAMQWALWFGLFKPLASGPLAASEIAARCDTAPRATGAVLAALATTPFLETTGGRFGLTELGRKWLLGDSAIRYLMGILEWDWLGRLAPFLRDGKAIDFHAHLSRDQWQIYQEMQYFRTRALAPLWSEQLQLSEGARDLLDLAGGHGAFAAHLCRQHPNLRAVVFDLPGAIDSTERVFSEEARGLERRLTRQAGDALEADLGAERYDVVCVLMLMHVLTEEQNAEILKKCARALRPGGLLVLLDRITNPQLDGQLDCFYYLVLGLGCASTAYSFDQLEGWQRAAGLEPFKRVAFETGLGDGLILARKPAATQG